MYLWKKHKVRCFDAEQNNGDVNNRWIANTLNRVTV